MNFYLGEEMQWEDLGTGLKRQIMGYDGKIMLVKVQFEDGAEGEPHSHHHSQSTYVESGEFEMTIDNEVKLLKAGDGFFIPSNVVHGCKCLKAGVLIDSFSPVREDFLQ